MVLRQIFIGKEMKLNPYLKHIDTIANAYRFVPKNQNYKTLRRKIRANPHDSSLGNPLDIIPKTSDTKTKFVNHASSKLIDIDASKDSTRKYIELYRTLKKSTIKDK